VNEAGTSSASGDMLPLFNSVKALFPTAGFGRPDLKYFKGFLTESLQTNGLVNGGTITAVETLLQSLIDDLSGETVPLVADDSAAYATVTVQEAVQMRQMHRRRRRTVTP